MQPLFASYHQYPTIQLRVCSYYGPTLNITLVLLCQTLGKNIRKIFFTFSALFTVATTTVMMQICVPAVRHYAVEVFALYRRHERYVCVCLMEFCEQPIGAIFKGQGSRTHLHPTQTKEFLLIK